MAGQDTKRTRCPPAARSGRGSPTPFEWSRLRPRVQATLFPGTVDDLGIKPIRLGERTGTTRGSSGSGDRVSRRSRVSAACGTAPVAGGGSVTGGSGAPRVHAFDASHRLADGHGSQAAASPVCHVVARG